MGSAPNKVSQPRPLQSPSSAAAPAAPGRQEPYPRASSRHAGSSPCLRCKGISHAHRDSPSRGHHPSRYTARMGTNITLVKERVYTDHCQELRSGLRDHSGCQGGKGWDGESILPGLWHPPGGTWSPPASCSLSPPHTPMAPQGPPELRAGGAGWGGGREQLHNKQSPAQAAN